MSGYTGSNRTKSPLGAKATPRPWESLERLYTDWEYASQEKDNIPLTAYWHAKQELIDAVFVALPTLLHAVNHIEEAERLLGALVLAGAALSLRQMAGPKDPVLERFDTALAESGAFLRDAGEEGVTAAPPPASDTGLREAPAPAADIDIADAFRNQTVDPERLARAAESVAMGDFWIGEVDEAEGFTTTWFDFPRWAAAIAAAYEGEGEA